PGSPLHSLHLGHPLVIAALEDARAAAMARRFTLRLHAGTPATAHLRGRRGRARIYRAVSRGFEVTEHLVPLVVLDPGEGPVPVEVARELLAQRADELTTPLDVTHVTDDALDDARDELMFLATDATGQGDQPRFARTIEQIERFLADRVLLLHQQRARAVDRVARAEVARDAAMGPEPRGAAEATLRKAQTEIDGLDVDIAHLRAGNDETYQRWRKHTQDRRYARPEFQLLLDAEIEVG
ncbi:MAG: hypothetical protein NT062_21180, partial [Proteobacteria bacterium]|nr:hypothetical protein [Pseudomonadota bacterium]